MKVMGGCLCFRFCLTRFKRTFNMVKRTLDMVWRVVYDAFLSCYSGFIGRFCGCCLGFRIDRKHAEILCETMSAQMGHGGGVFCISV